MSLSAAPPPDFYPQTFMIRSNVPLPFLYRLRLRAGAAARRAAAGPTAGRRPYAALRRPPAGTAAQVWLHFIDQYERFTETLCAAAKNGCDCRLFRSLHVGFYNL